MPTLKLARVVVDVYLSICLSVCLSVCLCVCLKGRHTRASVRAPPLVRDLVKELLLRDSGNINVLAAVSQLLLTHLPDTFIAVTLPMIDHVQCCENDPTTRTTPPQAKPHHRAHTRVSLRLGFRRRLATVQPACLCR